MEKSIEPSMECAFISSFHLNNSKSWIKIYTLIRTDLYVLIFDELQTTFCCYHCDNLKKKSLTRAL